MLPLTMGADCPGVKGLVAAYRTSCKGSKFHVLPNDFTAPNLIDSNHNLPRKKNMVDTLIAVICS